MPKKRKNSAKQKIKFKKGLKVGSAAAEDDEIFLEECFIHTEDLNLLCDVKRPESILLGRTGAGKTAVLLNLESLKDRIIRIEPNNLALNYISNSDVISFLTSLGVELDIFYQMLWRHVLSIELLKYYFDNNNSINMNAWLANVDKKRKFAASYLEKWDSHFFIETEEKVKEIITNFAEKIEVEGGINNEIIKLGAKAGLELEKKVKSEIVNQAKKVVDDVQIRDLGEVIRLIGEDLFSNERKPYYIIIDDLDRGWVSDKIRYKLIRALIETVKSFRNIPALKIIIAMRTDLLETVYNRTISTGFQPEKYKDLELNVSWTNEQLQNLLNRRLSYTMEKEFTKQEVQFSDVFPEKIGGKLTFYYMVERTLKRPRDIIEFTNLIFEEAQDKTELTEKIIRDAEARYSNSRKQSLIYEWKVEHPMLEQYFILLENKPSSFPIAVIKDSELDELVLKLIDKDEQQKDPITNLAIKRMDGKINNHEFLSGVLKDLYKIGIIGIKNKSFEKPQFSHSSLALFNNTTIDEDSKIYIHPMLSRSLGVFRPRKGTFIDPNQQASND